MIFHVGDLFSQKSADAHGLIGFNWVVFGKDIRK